MEMPEELFREISEAWSGPPPVLPSEWSKPDYLELHDMYLAFANKTWYEVSCDDLPLSFNALLLLIWRRAHTTEASGYYLASYMRCLFLLEGHPRVRHMSDIDSFLRGREHKPEFIGLSASRCRALAHFLEVLRPEFEAWDVFIADVWKAVSDRMNRA